MNALFRIVLTTAAIATHAGAFNAPFAISAIDTTPSGKYEVTFPANAGRYYVLHRSASPFGQGRAVAMELAQSDGEITLADASLPVAHGWYRVTEVLPNAPLDTDGDGLSDLLELQRPDSQNPLNPGMELSITHGSVILPTRTLYETLSHRDNFPGAEEVREVKFIVTGADTDNPSFYFVNSQTYEYHYYFVRDGLGINIGLGTFNNQAYFTNTNRRYMAGSIIAHDNYVSPTGARGIYTMEFWPTDPVAFEFVQKAYELFSASMTFVDGNLAYHPASETQRGRMRQEQALYDASFINHISTEELYGNVVYTALNQGEGYGRLRVPSATDTLSARDVVVFRTLPNDLTHVAGIISEVPQTPLSHINLKAKQNNTPNAFVKDASTHPDIAPLVGQDVYYRVLPDGFEIRAATEEEVDTWLESVRPPDPQFPIRDLSETAIADLEDIGFDDADAFGSKSANVGELLNIMPGVAPDGVAVPFHFYDAFMKHNGFYSQVQALLDNPAFQTNPLVRDIALANFRDTIEDNSTLPQWMLDALQTMHDQFPDDQPLRCRSSTNNEDLEGFNGAGLYISRTHYEDEGHIANTMRQIWAGLWTYRAFEERDFYRIDHLTAAMGVLVHPNYDNEQSNGVAITTNPFAPGDGWDGFYINVQAGENLVTNPGEEAIPEEFTVADLVGIEIQYIRFSNQIPEGERVMSEADILKLYDRMEDLHSHFRSLYRGGPDFAMEIEFKITADGGLAIKQARPWVE